jgi:hypothetical protein
MSYLRLDRKLPHRDFVKEWNCHIEVYTLILDSIGGDKGWVFLVSYQYCDICMLYLRLDRELPHRDFVKEWNSHIEVLSIL